MKQTFKTILEGIKLKIDNIIANIPKKLSELENDLPVVQSDWNQADENASGYIKNKPFWTNLVETVIVEETTFELVDGIGQLTAIQPLEVGQNCIVTLDGVQYNAICKTGVPNGSTEDVGFPYIGNLGLIGQGEDTGESFFIAHTSSETELGIMVNSDVAEHTVSVINIIEEVHQIDPKYIPDSVKTHDWNTLENRPFGTTLEDYVLFDREVITDQYNNVNFDEKIDIEVGRNYNVIIDGVEYLSEVSYYDDTDSLNCFYVKNNDEPMLYINENYAFFLLDVNGNMAHSLIVYIKDNEVINEIDPVYIPDLDYVSYIESQKLDSSQMSIARKNIGAASPCNSVWSGVATRATSSIIGVTLDDNNGFKLMNGVRISVRDIPMLMPSISQPLKLYLRNSDNMDEIIVTDIDGSTITSSNSLPWEDGNGKLVEFCYINDHWVVQHLNVASMNRYGLVKMSTNISDDDHGVSSSRAVKRYVDTKFTNGFNSLILLSPNGTKFNITVGDDGVLSVTEITE